MPHVCSRQLSTGPRKSISAKGLERRRRPRCPVALDIAGPEAARSVSVQVRTSYTPSCRAGVQCLSRQDEADP